MYCCGCHKNFKPDPIDSILCTKCFFSLIKLQCIRCTKIEYLNFNGLCELCNLKSQEKICNLCQERSFLIDGICGECETFGEKKYCKTCQTKEYFTKKGKGSCYGCLHQQYKLLTLTNPKYK